MFNRELANRENDRIAVAMAMRKHVGNGRRFDLDGLSDRTGIKRRTLQSYSQAQAVPPYDALLKLMRELPEEFADDILRPAGLGGVSRLTNEAPCDMQLLALMTGASSEISEAYATTGRVCHVRWPRVRAKLAVAFRHIGARLRQSEGARA